MDVVVIRNVRSPSYSIIRPSKIGFFHIFLALGAVVAFSLFAHTITSTIAIAEPEPVSLQNVVDVPAPVSSAAEGVAAFPPAFLSSPDATTRFSATDKTSVAAAPVQVTAENAQNPNDPELQGSVPVARVIMIKNGEHKDALYNA